MGQSLVLSIMRDDQSLFSIYQHWGGYTGNEIEVICKLISVYDKDDSLETLLKKTIETLPGSGIYLPEDHTDEIDAIMDFIAKGFPVAKDPNAGLIAVTPKTQGELARYAQDTQNLYLDAGNFLENTLWYISKDELEEDEIPVVLPSLFTTPVTKENALNLLARFEDLNDEVFIAGEGYLVDVSY